MKYNLSALKLAYDMNPYMGAGDFIYFWKPDEKEGKTTEACLCQWYPCKFRIDGEDYNCAEQFMMAEKARIFGDDEIRKEILACSDPEKIKKLGRLVKGFDENIWARISYDVVVRGNIAKFRQNSKLWGFLIATESKTLAEASPYDKIWGIGMKKEDAVKAYPHLWKGENRLGFALMEVRDILRGDW